MTPFGGFSPGNLACVRREMRRAWSQQRRELRSNTPLTYNGQTAVVRAHGKNTRLVRLLESLRPDVTSVPFVNFGVLGEGRMVGITTLMGMV
jgi:hypothetical protein